MVTHAPVMVQEVLESLAPAKADAGSAPLYVDATFGGGGYTRAILEAAPQARVVAIDRDPEAMARARAMAAAFPGRLLPAEGRFSQLDLLAGEPVDGVVLDIGVSSFQLDDPARGFSFRTEAPLDMRMERAGPSAMDAVARLSEPALADLLRDYGEEREARRVARAIARAREAGPIRTTRQLADLIEEALGGRKGARLHPATRSFQALRLLVNDELGELAAALTAAERILKPGGRLVVVSFHSLEDRLVKTALAARSGALGAGSRHAPPVAGPEPSFQLLRRGALEPSEAEVEANPRARSAKLRAATRTAAPARPTVEAPALALRARHEWSAFQ